MRLRLKKSLKKSFDRVSAAASRGLKKTAAEGGRLLNDRIATIKAAGRRVLPKAARFLAGALRGAARKAASPCPC